MRGGVVITGASSGIGEACALWLAELGYRVFAGVRRVEDGERLARAAAAAQAQATTENPEPAEAAGVRPAQAGHALGRTASVPLVPLLLDVTDAEAIGEAALRVEAMLGDEPLAGLVNNAGIAVGGPLEFIPLDDLREQLEVNVVGTVAMAQAFLPLLRRGGGRIVQMGSVSGRFASPFLGPYSASKFALEALSDALRVELRPWGIHVSIIEPGVIATPIWKKSLAAADEALTEMPPALEGLYGEVLAAVRREVEGLRGIPASRVANAVARALTDTRPRARYHVVAPSARLRMALSYLPTRLRDWVVARHLERGLGIRSHSQKIR